MIEEKFTKPKQRIGILTHNEIIHEPRHGSPDDGFPIPLQNEDVRNAVLNRVLGILFRVKHSQTEEEQGDGDDKSDSEAHSPDAVVELLPISCQDDHHNDSGRDETRVYGEAGRHGR